MERLSHKIWTRISESLHEIYAQSDLDQYRQAVLSGVHQLVPCNYVSFNELNFRDSRFLIHESPQLPILEKLVPVFETYFPQHPVHSVIQEGRTGAFRNSDFIPVRQFRKTDLFNEYYRKVDTHYQMIASLRNSRSELIALALNRDRSDFSERDRQVLLALSPHLIQAFSNAQMATQLRQSSAFQESALENAREGIVFLDAEGRKLWSSAKADRLLKQFGSPHDEVCSGLPPVIARWLEVQKARARESLWQMPEPLFLERENARLVVRRVLEADRELLVLKEEDHSIPLSIRVQFSLTRRECEILEWICQGKINGEIAVIFGISLRTVQKHLEHLLDKMEVENRSALITRIAELRT